MGLGKMKRIIDGVTYNTDSSTKLGLSEYDTEFNHRQHACHGVLYQTRGGAFFVHEMIALGQNDDNGAPIFKNRFRALGSDDAKKWLMPDNCEVFHNPFDAPPEAVSEPEQSTTVYLRVPQSLKKRIEKAAESDELSVNSWTLRCVERCLSVQRIRAKNDLGFAWSLVNLVTDPGSPAIPSKTKEAMLVEAAHLIKSNWRGLGLMDDDARSFDEDMENMSFSEEFGSRLNSFIADRNLPDIE